MTENPRQIDEFEKYRNWKHWNLLKPKVLIIFPDRIIPPDMEIHLAEWVGVYDATTSGAVGEKKGIRLMKHYMELHDPLFENSLFLPALRRISNGIAG